jgi:DNA-binding transcriptional regulator PaaX
VIGLLHDGVRHMTRKTRWSKLNDYIAVNTSHLDVSSQDISKMVYELHRRKYIENRDGDSIVLTNKAKLKIIDRITDEEGRDGKYRLVSFDIPEIKRGNRNCFRRAIKRMGFVQVQKSLWVTDRNVSDFVEMAAKEYGVDDFVAYFVAEGTNIDKHIADVLIRKDKMRKKYLDTTTEPTESLSSNESSVSIDSKSIL